MIVPSPSPLTGVANAYEKVHSKYLRSWAAAECLHQIKADDKFTHCISIGPVSVSRCLDIYEVVSFSELVTRN